MRILLFVAVLLFAGCGYYPVSYYAKQSLGGSIFVESIVSLSDPENSVLAKDALNRAILTRLQSNLTTKENADTIVYMDITSIDIYSIADSNNGFASFYRMNVKMTFSYTDKNGNARKFTNRGIYDFSVESESTITDKKRSIAISEACTQAIDKFIAQVAYTWR